MSHNCIICVHPTLEGTNLRPSKFTPKMTRYISNSKKAVCDYGHTNSYLYYCPSEVLIYWRHWLVLFWRSVDKLVFIHTNSNRYASYEKPFYDIHKIFCSSPPSLSSVYSTCVVN